MSTVAKVFVVLNLILGLVFVTISGVLFSQQENWKQEATRWQNSSDKWKDDYQELDKTSTEKINALVADKTNLMHQVQDKEDEIVQKNTEITRLTDQAQSLREDNKNLQKSFDDLAKKWDTTDQALKTTITELDRRTAEQRRLAEAKSVADEEVVRLTAALGESTRTITRLNDQIQQQQANIGRYQEIVQNLKRIAPQIYPVVIEQSQRGKVMPNIRGKVMAVDQDTGIVLLSVGREDQVEKDFKFIVSRGAKYIGQVIVDKVFAQQSSARIDKIYTPNPKDIMVGDEIQTNVGS